jgi:hypothetical protein
MESPTLGTSVSRLLHVPVFTDMAGIPPISIVISGVSMVMRSGLLTLGFQLAIVLAALYGLYKYREAVGKSMLFLVRKVTGKRR